MKPSRPLRTHSPSTHHLARQAFPWAASRVFGVLLLLGLLVSGLHAQTTETGGNVKYKIEGDSLVIAVSETQGVSLKEFITLAKNVTGKVFTFDEQDLNNPDAKINFIGEVKVKKDEFFSFFQTVLYIKNFACVVRGGGQEREMVQVIHFQNPKRREIAAGARLIMPEDLEKYKNQTGVQILTSIRMSHVDANKAVTTVRPFFSGQVGGGFPLQIGNAGDQRSVLLMGFGNQVYQAVQLFKLVDVEEEAIDQVIEPVKLEHQAAEELEPVLNELLNDRNQPRGRGQPAGGLTQPTQMKILAQPSTETLILSGTKEQVSHAKDIIAQLDIPMEITGGDAHVIQLKNVIAKDLRQTLNQFITDDIQAQQAAQAGGQGATARRPRKPVIVAHDESNSLLVSAPSTKYAQLSKMIQKLDRRQPQVLIEAAVVELSTNDIVRYGIELGLLDIKENGSFTRPFGFTTFNISNFEDTDDDGLPDTRLPDFENPLTGFTGGILRNSDFAIPVLINALGQDNKANVLSLPSVVVNNNEDATVATSEDRPTQNVSQGNATTQSGFEGFQGAGITLNISPSISSNNYLRLNIDLEVSRFLTPFDPNSTTPGVKATRQIKTVVTMPSGHTMVLGGVIEDQESQDTSGVPFLMDIPILGWLFKSSAKEERKVNLYFFLTPHILDEDDFSDLAAISFRKKLEADQYIGTRRIQIIDPAWRGPGERAPPTLDSAEASLEDMKNHMPTGFPNNSRPPVDTKKSNGNTPGPVAPKKDK